MEKTIQQIPFLRLSIALAVGIIIGQFIRIPTLVLYALLSIILIFIVLIHRNYKYRQKSLFGFIIHLFFIVLGILLFQQHNKEPIFYNKEKFVATILEVPQEKENSFKSLIQLNTFSQEKDSRQTKENIIVYFQKDTLAKNLNAGDIILFNQVPQTINNNGNPYEFDYKKYLNRKKIYRQIYLPTTNWIKSDKTSNSVAICAEKIREKLLTIYRNQAIGKTELEILSALTLGYKRELDQETKRIFSAAGAMHVLAVSGLHVGIVFWIFNILFGFLKSQKIGRIIFVCLSILFLWSFAFVTGLSPSVMRAACMFTIYIIGDTLQRKSNIYNSLAASAFLLLIINPNNIFELGFQLSYAAVFGIVFLQAKIYKLIEINNKIVRFFWTLLTVSIAAQIATFPITAFYFGQFPSYFFITNLIIIPAAMVLIPLGIALLIFAKIPILSSILAAILNVIIKGVYIVLSYIERLPLSTLEISINQFQYLLLIGIALLIFLFIKTKKQITFKIALVFTLFLSIVSTIRNFTQRSTNEIIVYNAQNNIVVQLIRGKQSFVVSDKKPQEFESLNFLISSTNQKLGLKNTTLLNLKDSLVNNEFYLKKGILFFEGKSIIFNKNYTNIQSLIKPDFSINPMKTSQTNKINPNTTIIITNKRFLQKTTTKFPFVHYTQISGAFRKNW